jgi:hypothetical protein
MPTNLWKSWGAAGLNPEVKTKLLALLKHVAFQTEQLADFVRNSVVASSDIYDLEVQVEQLHRLYDELVERKRTKRAARVRDFEWQKPWEWGSGARGRPIPSLRRRGKPR